jgi:hypothetical protein
MSNYHENLGLLVHAMARHEPGDYGDSIINDPIMNLIDDGATAGEFLQELANMHPGRVAGILGQYHADDDREKIKRSNEENAARDSYGQALIRGELGVALKGHPVR